MMTRAERYKECGVLQGSPGTLAGSTERHGVPLLVYDVWGVSVGLGSDQSGVLSAILELVLPDWESVDASPDCLFEIVSEGQRYRLLRSGEVLQESLDWKDLIEVLRGRLHLEIALRSCTGIFVHAGLVGVEGQGILIPGASCSGKSTLVAALVELGAQFYSDEYAIVDAAGRLHTYPTPAMVRLEGSGIERRPVEELGWRKGLPGLIWSCGILAEYDQGARWQALKLSSGEGMLAVFQNTVSARSQPSRVLDWLRRAGRQAVCFRGKRGEARACASEIIEWLSSKS